MTYMLWIHFIAVTADPKCLHVPRGICKTIDFWKHNRLRCALREGSGRAYCIVLLPYSWAWLLLKPWDQGSIQQWRICFSDFGLLLCLPRTPAFAEPAGSIIAPKDPGGQKALSKASDGPNENVAWRHAASGLNWSFALSWDVREQLPKSFNSKVVRSPTMTKSPSKRS